MSGILYICPTPIGNIQDITIRTLEIFKNVDLIAAEDTRRTIKLLNHYQIQKPLTSYHEHNKESKGNYLIEKLLQGENIAQVSDAGMPGISDPGEDLIKKAHQLGIKVEVLPGASAFLIALINSGLDTHKFVFEGFLPRSKKERRKELESVKYEPKTMIFYEAPHRIKEVLEDMFKILSNRKITIAKELTKIHETFLRMNISEAISYFQENDPKGEYVIILEGCSQEKPLEHDFTVLTIKEHVEFEINQGLNKKDSIKKVAKLRNLSKNEVYQEVLDLE